MSRIAIVITAVAAFSMNAHAANVPEGGDPNAPTAIASINGQGVWCRRTDGLRWACVLDPDIPHRRPPLSPEVKVITTINGQTVWCRFFAKIDDLDGWLCSPLPENRSPQ